MKTKPLFVTFEGVDGSGKSTQLKLLRHSLTAGGRPVLTVREPGGTEVGEAIRSILLEPSYEAMDPVTELFLFAAARTQLLAEVIRPALATGQIVLCDRFIDSTLAYQGYGRGLDIARLRDLNRLATGDVSPDLTFLLELDPAAGLERVRAGRGQKKDRMESSETEFFDRVATGYKELAGLEPDRFFVIDATLSVETIQAQIEARVREELEK